MGWLIAAGILFLLGILPLGASIRYDESGVRVKILAGWISLQIFPRKPKEKKEKTQKTEEPGEKKPVPKKTSAPKPKASHVTDTPQQKKGGSVTDFLPLVKLALNLLGDFRRKLRVNRLEVKLVLAGDDPCDLAMNYGRAWEALGNLLPKLENWLVIGQRDVDVQCDFTAEQTLVTARLDLTITLGRILGLGVVYGVRAIRELIHIQKKRKIQKGGAVE